MEVVKEIADSMPHRIHVPPTHMTPCFLPKPDALLSAARQVLENRLQDRPNPMV